MAEWNLQYLNGNKNVYSHRYTLYICASVMFAWFIYAIARLASVHKSAIDVYRTRTHASMCRQIDGTARHRGTNKQHLRTPADIELWKRRGMGLMGRCEKVRQNEQR